MAGVAKAKLSGSTDGRNIKVTATASPGTVIHTAVAGVVSGTYDEVWLYLASVHTADLAVTVQMGGTTGPDDNMVITIPANAGRYLVLDGQPFQNGTIVRVYCGTANVILASGFVNAITA